MAMQDINQIFHEFVAMKDMIRNEVEMRNVIDRFNESTTFNVRKCMEPFCDRFPNLVEFIGGLASIFSGSSTVESDFSVMGVEKDCYRQCLTDISLEGVMQSKEFASLQQICNRLTSESANQYSNINKYNN